jgi:hypothetical protein
MGTRKPRTKESRTDRKARVEELPVKALPDESAATVKGGLKMLTSAREAEEKAKNLASGVNSSRP